VKKHANGANVLHLNPDRIEGYIAAIPPASLAARFGERIAAALHQQDVLALKNEALSEARDLLLPRLVSGEIELRP
jgi:type I restriction enzyme, S subunit